MDTFNTNSTESKESGIGRFFAGKTFPQILFGSAIWACILGYALFCIGQIAMYLILAHAGRAAGFSSDVWYTALVYLEFLGVWVMFFLQILVFSFRGSR